MLLRVPLALGLVVPLILLGLRTWDGTHPRLLATAAWQNIGVGAGGERRLLESPSNITATHRGVWHKLTFPAPASDLGWLQQSTGIAVIKLRIVGSPEGGVFNVEGDMVLRDGQYVSSGDSMFRLQGVHVPAAGRLMAVVQPARVILQPVPAPCMKPQWRHDTLLSGRRVQKPRAAKQQQGSADAEWRQHGDEVLRAAARQLAVMASNGQAAAAGAGSDELTPPKAPAGNSQKLSWQACDFMLDLRVHAAAAPAAHSARRGRSGGDDPALSLRQRMLGGSQRSDEARGVEDGAVQVDGAADLALNGTLVSRSCGMRLSLSLATARVDEYHSKAGNYTLMITALGFLQVLLLLRQMEACSTPALASRVSLLTLAHQAVLDAYLCLVHLTLGIMLDSLLHSFGTVAFMQFVVFAIFEFRFLLSVWRARGGASDPWAAHREVSVLYARFYAALLGGILLTYQLQRHMPLLMFVFFSFWLPQIVLCLRTDCRQPLRPEFVLGTSLARLALPLYIYGCPSNLLRVQPDLPLCTALVAFVGLQCAVLMAQHWWGPRCFVPKALLPQRYDYSRLQPAARCVGSCDVEGAEGCSRECVICMSQVDVCDRSERALTPCCHTFHRACLEQWLSHKHDCPTCRRALPPL
ncbi:hypothetical protein D9Q98_000719 [Chlorella vulgaris]|uniref:RING-type E3 ubiquitin transferase n=1 Tax=Chlorella vulgaris TaxID=3077 RepID=A0A9D4TZN9_CHLVU|nr:hypothetical protein D9Q98_000719 [Chlorella vulgaris]